MRNYKPKVKTSCVSSGGSRGVPRVPWNPPFGFSCDRKLWKPGLQQNPTVMTVTTN